MCASSQTDSNHLNLVDTLQKYTSKNPAKNLVLSAIGNVFME